MRTGRSQLITSMVLLLHHLSGVVGAHAGAATQVQSIDIHIPLEGLAFSNVVRANAFLNGVLNNTEVEFGRKDTPHITLYLTAFICPPSPQISSGSAGCVGQIRDAIAQLLPKLGPPLGPCLISLTTPYAAGNYAMCNVSNSPCLQSFSDLIVNATHRFAQVQTTLSPWCPLP